jgi:hypothetical protein
MKIPRYVFFGKCVSVVFLLLSLASCGKNGTNQFINSVKVESSVRDGDVYVDLSAIMNLYGLSMTAIEVNVIDPDDPEKIYGVLKILPTLDKRTQILLGVNLSDAANIPGGGEARLPNNSPVPIGGLDGVEIIQMAVSDIQARIYLGLSEKSLLLGFAIPIKEMDSASRYLGPVNIFPGFEYKGYRGMVGIFTGKESNQSGVAMFMDLSPVLNPEALEAILKGYKLDSSELSQVKSNELRKMSSLVFPKKKSLSSTELKKLNQWKQQHKKLHFISKESNESF